MKKFLSIILSILMVVTMIPLSVLPAFAVTEAAEMTADAFITYSSGVTQYVKHNNYLYKVAYTNLKIESVDIHISNEDLRIYRTPSLYNRLLLAYQGSTAKSSNLPTSSGKSVSFYTSDTYASNVAKPVVTVTCMEVSEPVWSWNGVSSATAVFTSTDGGATMTVDAAIEISEKTAENCLETDTTAYTATATANGKEYTNVKTIYGEQGSHNIEYIKSGDYMIGSCTNGCGMTCTHNWTDKNDYLCDNCGFECHHESYTDGFCTVCGFECAHENITDGKCDDCGEDGIVVTITMTDSYGDGWRGNAIVVKQLVDGAYTEVATATFEDGASETFTALLRQDGIYAFSWVYGEHPEDCGFTLAVDGETVYECADVGTLADSEIFYIICKHTSYTDGKCDVCDYECPHENQTGSVCEICGEHICSYNNGFCTECDAYQPATLVTNENYESFYLKADYVGYYAISNAGQLFWFAQQVNEEGNKEIKGVLTADIYLENRPWTPIGAMGEENSFRGIFDGLNYIIWGLYVEGSENGVGFFGEVRTGTVKNFAIYGNVVVNTEVDYVGGVIGSICGVNGETDLERNGAIVQNIKSIVNITVKAHGVGTIGGLVGHADHESLIEQCIWSGTFNAGEYHVDSGAGGFIGKIQENTGEVTIRNCGAYGTIKTGYEKNSYNNNATIYMGGFLSFSDTGAKTTIEKCLFAGKFERGENLTDEAELAAFGTLRSVNAIKNCYYPGDDGLAAVHSDSPLNPGSDNVEITSVTEEELRGGSIATQLGDFWEQGEHYPSLKDMGGHIHSHSYTYTDNGDGTHDQVCSVCDYVEVDNEAHSGGTATCTEQAKCERCGTIYGELDPDNHDFGSGNTCICGAEIAFTGIVVDDENSDEYRYDETRKTYTIIIPADEVGGIGYLSYDIIGTNLTLIEDTNTLLKVQHENEDGLTPAPDDLLVDVLQDNGCFGWSVLGYGDGEWEKLLYSNDGGMTWTTYTFEVKQAYSITVNASQNGTVTANEYAIEGDNIALNVSPAEGYMLDTLSVTDASGNSVDVENNAFTMPASAVTVTATFAVCDHKDGRHETATDNGDGTHDATYSCCGAIVAEVPHTLDVTTGKCSACGADMTVIATVTDGTNTYYAADAATLNQAVTAILETGSRTFTVELPADAPAEMITAIRRAICDTDGVADGSIHLTLGGVTSIPGTTNWDGVAFGPGDIYDEAGEIVDQELVTQLASINLPDVTEIGAQAFYFCENLVSVSAPKAQTIGAQALGYTALTSVEFPELTTIPTDMFSGTWTLSSAKFPKVTTIEQGGLLVGAKFNPENNPTPFPLELTAEGDITFNGSNHFNIASQNYSGKVDLVLCCDKADKVTKNEDGTATWQVRDDLSYTFKSITFKHSYTDGVCTVCGFECPHENVTGATCITPVKCDVCGYSVFDWTNHEGEYVTVWFNDYQHVSEYECCHIGTSIVYGDHDYKDYTITTPADCVNNAWETGKCICGDTHTREIAGSAKNHDWSDKNGICTNCGEVCPHEKYTDGVCDKCGYECAHEWGEGVLTRPTFETAGYYTYTCTLCGHSYTEPTKRADDTALNDASMKVMEYIGNSTLTQEAANEIHNSYLDILKNNGNIFDEFGFVRNDLVEEDQPAIDAVTEELQKIIDEAEEKIASGEYVKADYTEIDEAIDDIEEKLASENVTDEGKAELEEIKKQLEEMKADENTSAADVAELEKALDDYEEELDKGIEDGTLVEVDVDAITDDVNKKWAEKLEAEGLLDEYEDFINNQKATDEAMATLDEINDFANSLEGTVAENAENIAKLNEMLNSFTASWENCLRGTHNFKDYEVTSPAKCEVNAIETGTCWFCGETDEREVEGTALKHSFTKYEETEAPKCGVAGKEVAYCDNGCQTTDEREIPALEHIDNNGDYICDHGCGHEFEKPVEPEQPDDPSEKCDHLCHKDGILGFLWKIISFFYRLFNIQQYCDCGEIHYDAPVFG